MQFLKVRCWLWKNSILQITKTFLIIQIRLSKVNLVVGLLLLLEALLSTIRRKRGIPYSCLINELGEVHYGFKSVTLN